MATSGLGTSTSILHPSPLDIVVPDTPQEYRNPAELRSRMSKLYFSLTGDHKRAQRFDYCGRFRDKRDKQTHRKREYQHCVDFQCLYCGTHIAKSTFERWKNVLKDAESGIFRLTYVEAFIPHAERSRETVLADLESLDDRLIEFSATKEEKLAPRWDYTPGYQADTKNLVIRVLYLGNNFSEQEWVAMFPPKAVVRVLQYRASQLSYVFQNRLLAVSLSKDPSDRAEQSAIFAGMKRFRAHGIRLTKNDLFADTPLSAERFLESEEMNETVEDILDASHEHEHSGSTPDDADRCPICGEEYVEESQWFDRDAPNPRPEDIRWYPRRSKHPPN